METKDRFFAKVIKTENCWNWIGSNNGVGYGEIRVLGKKIYAHRWSYEFHTGKKIPEGFHVDHLCRNRSCVNPDHLEPVTCKVNIRRGNTAKPQLVKTHCSQGHEYTEENSYRRQDGKGRNCNECVRIRSREYQRRKRAAL